jgi:uncharacterized protein YhfF
MTGGPRRPELGSLLARLGEDGFVVPARAPRVEWFGDDPALGRELGDLVAKGVKQASAGLLWEWEADGDPLPRVGDVEIIVDWSGEPLAVVEVTDARILPFQQVDEAFARDEGEGDGTLASWRAGHWRYFSRACQRLGREPSETMPVVCRRFTLLHAVGATSRGRSWALFRQDEHGNRTRVVDTADRAEAELLLAEYEAKGHNQMYWIEAGGQLR